MGGWDGAYFLVGDYMLTFYDFEVFAYDWLVVLIDLENQSESVIHNDREKLIKYYEKHKNDIWVGYNSRSYDQHVLKAVISGFDPKEVNDYIILENKNGWNFSQLMNKIQIYNYDVFSGYNGLKTLECFMGNDIRETSVPFDIDRPLTEKELQETIKYCRHDVEQTIEVFFARKKDFDAHLSVIKTFGLPLSYISKTQAQLTAAVLECERVERDDEWDIQIIDTLKIEKYKSVIDWFLHNKGDYSKKLEIDVCGVPHVFGWGGLHGAREKYHAKGLIVHVDVNSFYPAIMIEYDLLSRNVKHKEKYREIRDTRIKYKKEKNPLQAPYKIILNATYGICKDKYSAAYDPRQANNVCINGQLLLLDLLEHIEPYCELIQSNTDGLIVRIDDTEEAWNKLDDVCYEWEQRTRMGLGFDIISEIWQKDVNNYVWIDEDGQIERKGAYVKELNSLDYDLPIVNNAMVDYMTKKIPVEYTINSCNDLIEFQKSVKLSNKFEYVTHNGKRYDQKCYRVFASKLESDGKIEAVKTVNGKLSFNKFANTPEHCFIYNESVNGVKVPSILDKGYYIDLAKQRLNDYGM